MKDYASGKNYLINSEKLKNCINLAMQSGNDVFNYSNVKGETKLRDLIAKMYSQRFGVKITYHNIMITNGSSQSLNIVLDALNAEKYNKIAVKSPFYYGLNDICKQKSLNLFEFDFDNLNSNLNNSVFYLTPNFNNPSGECESEVNKRKLCQFADKNSCYVIEDDPYSFFDYKNRVKKSMLNYSNRVIYLGTFSKIISPSVNVGFVVCFDENIIKKLYVAKKASSIHTSKFLQEVVYEYLKTDDLNEEINKKTAILNQNYHFLSNLLKNTFKNEVEIKKAQGGFFLLATFKNNISCLKNKLNFNLETLENYYIHSVEIAKRQVRFNLSNVNNLKDVICDLYKAYHKFHNE